MDDNNDFGLSRRQMLGGLGMIGVASAGAGLGTTAYFSDEESFTDNTLTAGSLDLFVHVDYSEDQGSFGGYQTPAGTYIQGGVIGQTVDEDGIELTEGEELQIEVEDLKPGDSGEGEFCFSIVDNPAYLWMCGELTANDENTVTEPEADADGETDSETDTEIDGNGELADAMQVTVSYCAPDGETGDTIVSGSLAEVMDALSNGVPLSGDGDADAPIANRPHFDGVDAPFDDDVPQIADQCVCFTWEVPGEEVGNEIQTDSVTFDFEFYAEQARHNDGTNNPCVESVAGEGFPELEDTVWHVRGIYGDGGGAANREMDIRLPNDTVLTPDTNVSWPNGEAVPFELSIENDNAKWIIDGTQVSVAPAPLPTANAVVVMAKASAADSSIEVSDVAFNGTSPSGPDAVSADGNSPGQQNITLNGVSFGEGDVISGMVEMSWPTGSPPNREGLGFRIDV
ncbi:MULTISPECIES: choice-of-anchor W domain-containing protein [Haloferacaceae]|uniref:Choice-of-anchor W domain-containing protein n=1 Tax=Halorubrum glutamatedens TaxID=2707018 RepID=A0ABD5QS21_9EURY|nr:choice-of-anchor W domain-containing protein [Halobellus captivus]